MHHIVLWLVAAIIIAALLVSFIIRRFRREAGIHEKPINWKGDDAIHYEMDDDSL